MSYDTTLHYIGHTGADLSSRYGCYETTSVELSIEVAYACEFYLPAGGENFAILFHGGWPIYYEYEWVSLSPGWW